MKTVYLLYTKNETLKWVPELLAVYKKSSYQTAYNRLADIADLHKGKVTAGQSGKVAAQVIAESGQVWWLERWDCE